jgi:hypothetical protein
MVKNALKIWMRRFNNAAFRQKLPCLTFIELKKRRRDCRLEQHCVTGQQYFAGGW